MSMTYALVTGASKGIGRAIAEELARRGHSVLLVARSEKALSEFAAQIREKYKVETDFLALDLATTGTVQKILEWCEEKKYSVNILVNNAGYGLSGPFEKYELTDHLDMMRLNMRVPVELCRLFLPSLRRQPGSYILNIASTAAYQAVPNLSLYSATKAFILTFSRGLRQELKGSSVSVTCVSPGSTDTDFVVRAQIGDKGLKAARRVNMTPEKVARIALSAMFAGKAEVITGMINKIGALMVWLLPKGLVERTAMKIYE